MEILNKNWMVKPFSIIILLCVFSLAIWFFLIIPEFEKIPLDFEFYMEHTGEDQIASVPFGELSEPFRLKELLYQKVSSVEGNVLTISSQVLGERSDTGEIVFDLTKEYQVDRTTKMHVDKEENLFYFPPGMEKRGYHMFDPLIFDEANLVYEGNEILNGLEVYVFTAEIKNDDVSDAFPQFASHKIYSDTKSTFWVEPITGDLLHFEKHWEDSIVEDGIKKNIVQKGWKKTTSFSEFILSEASKTKIIYINFYKIFLPLVIIAAESSIGLSLILRKRFELVRGEVAKQEKLAVIGKLSARVAHDLRNPLSVIMNVNTLDKINPPKTKEEFEKRKEMVTRAIERMSHQLDRVMEFVKTKPLELEYISVKTIIDAVENSIVIPNGIKIVCQGEETKITCDPAVMEALFSNLILNSIFAMDSKGTISIKVQEEPNISIIKVIDQGPGIPKENMNKIFEPLFTTKQVGTGLGLASCKSIAEEHGGTISFSNDPTTFTITLPKRNRDLGRSRND